MAKRYSPLGKEPDRIFARGDASAADAERELAERAGREEEEISTLAASPVFGSWLRRIVRQQGGVLVNAIRTEAGQAQGLSLYCILADIARTGKGQQLVSEIVSEQFGKTKKGNGR